MDIRKWTTCVSLGMAVAVCGAAQASDSVLLTPKHTTGDSFYFDIDQHIIQKVSSAQMPGGSMTFNVHRIYGLVQTVKDAAKDLVKLELKFDRVSQKIEAGAMMNVFYDSDDPENEETAEQLAAALSPMLGMPINFELDKDFHVTYVRGMGDIRAAVSGKSGSNPFLRQLAQELNDERAKFMYGDSRYILYANKDVKVGDTWHKELSDVLPNIGKVNYQYDCKLDRISEVDGRKAAVVAFEGTAKKATSPTASTQPSGPNMTLDGTFKGTATYDMEKGLFTRSDYEGHSKIVATPEDDEDNAGATKIDLTVKSVMTVSSKAAREKTKEAAQEKAEAAKKAAEEKKAARKKARDEKRAQQKSEKKNGGDKDDEDDDDSDDDGDE